MMKWAMRRKNVSTLPQLMEMAREQGVKLVACTTCSFEEKGRGSLKGSFALR